MSDRRWGRVTVEGWVEEHPLRREVLISMPNEVAYWTFPSGNASVVFLPEPVQFKDGDALRETEGHKRVWVRFAGAWTTPGMIGTVMYDPWIQRGFEDRFLVRLVPEANGG